MKLNQRGFSHLEISLLLVVVLFVCGVGYYVYKNRPTSTTTQSVVQPGVAESADAIKSSADLTTVDSELDQLETDSDINEISQLENEIQNL